MPATEGRARTRWLFGSASGEGPPDFPRVRCFRQPSRQQASGNGLPACRKTQPNYPALKHSGRLERPAWPATAERSNRRLQNSRNGRKGERDASTREVTDLRQRLRCRPVHLFGADPRVGGRPVAASAKRTPRLQTESPPGPQRKKKGHFAWPCFPRASWGCNPIFTRLQDAPCAFLRGATKTWKIARRPRGSLTVLVVTMLSRTSLALTQFVLPGRQPRSSLPWPVPRSTFNTR